MSLDARLHARCLRSVLRVYRFLLARTGAFRVVDDTRAGAALRRCACNLLFRRLVPCLARSALPEHRELAVLLAARVDACDYPGARAVVRTASSVPDLRGEKVISHRYRFVWICVPKVASRSLIAALCTADPDAELVRSRTLDEIFARRPQIRDYFRFAFVRHPVDRAFSFYADKHVWACRAGQLHPWSFDAWYGLAPGMTFAALCRWLDTPCGSDAFSDRHWLSQHRQLVCADGRPPDFLGRYETLDADWRLVADRLGIPWCALPLLNVRAGAVASGFSLVDSLAADTVSLLTRRYAQDFSLGGYALVAPGLVSLPADPVFAVRSSPS